MKNLFKISLVIIALITLNSCNNSKKTTEKEATKTVVKAKEVFKNKYQLGQNNAGIFVKGEKAPTAIPESFLIEEKTRTKSEEGETWDEKYFQVSENGNKLFTYMIGRDYETKKENVVVDVVIYSELFKTAENIGLNATIEDFIKAYPYYKIWYTYIGDIFVIQSNTQKVQFLIDAKDYTGKKEALYGSEQVILKKSDFKANSKIKSIRIF
jgi:hypothetical protein